MISLKRPWLVAALLVLGIGIISAYATILPPKIGIDDADINFVYARNLALGHGFVYTPGHERVEGATSALWTVLLVPGFWLGIPQGWALLLCVALTLVAVWAAMNLGCQAGGPVGRALVLVGVASLGDFFVWSCLTLMDSALYSAAIGLAVMLAAKVDSTSMGRRGTFRMAAASSLLSLSRPEGGLVAPLLAILSGVAVFVSLGNVRMALRRVAVMLVPSLVSSGILVAIRMLYFGYPLPNTYYAKVSPDRLYAMWGGAKYVAHFMSGNPVQGTIALGAVFLLLLQLHALLFRPRTAVGPDASAVFMAGGTLAIGLVMPLFSGGDHFVGARLLQPFLPISFVSWVPVAVRTIEMRSRLPSQVAVLLVIVGVGWTSLVRRSSDYYTEFAASAGGRAIGRLLTDCLPKGGRVGVTFAGGIAFAYPYRVVDLLGLNWVKMAHAPGTRHGLYGHAAFSESVFWTDPPDVVSPQIPGRVPRSVCDTGYYRNENKLLRGLYDARRFREEYVPVVLTARGGLLSAFIRRRFLESLHMSEMHRLQWPSNATISSCPSELQRELAPRESSGDR
jgi:hypothetical protein